MNGTEIKLSDTTSFHDLKLGKSLYIALNEDYRTQHKISSSKIQLNSNSKDNQDDHSSGGFNNDNLFSSSSNWNTAIEAIERSIQINAIDSMKSVLYSISNKYQEIGTNSKTNWKLDFIPLLSNHHKSSSGQKVKLELPPTQYYTSLRLFQYISNNHQSLLYKSILNIIKNNNNNDDNQDTTTTTISTPYSKEDKKTILDLFNCLTNYLLITQINSSNNNTNSNSSKIEQDLNCVSEILSFCIDKIIVDYNTTDDKGMILPTLFTITACDLIITLLLINLDLIQQSISGNDDHDNNDKSYQMLTVFLKLVLSFVNNIEKWYNIHKPLLAWSIERIKHLSTTILLSLTNDSDYFKHVYNTFTRILPLFYQKYPITKIQLLNQYIDKIESIESNNNSVQQLDDAYLYCLSIFIILGTLSEKNLNTYISEKKDNMSSILSILTQYQDSEIQLFISKFMEFIFHIKLNIDSNGNFETIDTLLLIIDHPDNLHSTIPESLIQVLSSSIAKYPQILFKKVLSLLKSLPIKQDIAPSDEKIQEINEDDNDYRIENTLSILSKTFQLNPILLDQLDQDVSIDLVNLLIPLLSASHQYRFKASLLLANIDPYLIIDNVLDIMLESFTNNDHKALSGSIDAFVQTFVSTHPNSNPSFVFDTFLQKLLGESDNNNYLIENNHNSNNNPSTIGISSNSNQSNNNNEKLLDIFPKISESINNSDKKFDIWKVVTKVFLIKYYANSKESVFSKALKVILKYIPDDICILIIFPNTLEKFLLQSNLINNNSNSTSESFIFSMLSPILVLRTTINNIYTYLKQQQLDNNNQILVQDIIQQLFIRFSMSSLLPNIRNLCAESIGFFPIKYWIDEMITLYDQQTQLTITNIKNGEIDKSNLTFSRLILSSLVIGYTISPKEIVQLPNATNSITSNIHWFFSLQFQSFKIEPDIQDYIAKIRGSSIDIIALLIRSCLSTSIETITINHIKKVGIPNNLLEIKNNFEIVPMILKSALNNSLVYNGFGQRPILLDILTNVAHLITEQKEATTYSKYISPILIKFYFIREIGNGFKSSLINTLCLVFFKGVDYEPFSEDLYEMAITSMKSNDENLRESGIKIIGILMKSMSSSILSPDRMREIEFILKSFNNHNSGATDKTKESANKILQLFK
ncbi:hypothetical protein CYY_007666 [Polysphondylium violaceum]|uniref:Uncharacterized protein n=1 Tax=Polysphondylium violaceum TaxID=133409 RepID=A0A8J4UXW5_9MYCE|nr:hypothetical protein CYY_007666 [Polysphondylium violaceum]